MSDFKIAGATLNQTPLDWEQNFKNISNAITAAKSEEIQLVCLPELCITGYGCEDMFLAPWVAEKALKYLFEIRKLTANIAVAVGLPVYYKGSLYNTSCLIADQKILGFHAKQHLANDGIHYEKRWFTEWKSGEIGSVGAEMDHALFGDVILEVNGQKIGFEICEDAWHENTRPAHSHCERNVDVILNPSASHFSFGKWKSRKHLVESSSDRFDCTYVYVNILGNESGRAIYDGDVYIAQNGKISAQNNRFSFKDYVLTSESGGVTNSFEIKEEEFVQAESLALFDYMRKSRSNGFVLSLSGGADSTTSAILVSEMQRRSLSELGETTLKNKINNANLEFTDLKNILTCAYQGTRNSSNDTLQAAKELALELGATFHNWTIDEEVEGYTQKVEKAIGRTLNWEQDDITLQNIQARARSPIIWMFANMQNALLLATSNRSEASVGYATMDGDTSGSISPIAGVDKHFIRNWLIWAEINLGYKSLKYVNNLEPTAELRPLDQKQEDEKDLMPYDILNEIERELIYHKNSVEDTIEKINNLFNTHKGQEYVEKFTRLWTRNQWKRERYAPSFHLDDHNVDSRTWMRYPILSGGFI